MLIITNPREALLSRRGINDGRHDSVGSVGVKLQATVAAAPFHHVNQVKKKETTQKQTHCDWIEAVFQAGSFKEHKRLGSESRPGREDDISIHSSHQRVRLDIVVRSERADDGPIGKRVVMTLLKIPRPRRGARGERVRSTVGPGGRGVPGGWGFPVRSVRSLLTAFRIR